MNIKSLENHLKQVTQYRLAKDLGITSGAIDQALTKKRNIFIVTDDEKVTAFEVKPAFNSDIDIKKINDKLDI